MPSLGETIDKTVTYRTRKLLFRLLRGASRAVRLGTFLVMKAKKGQEGSITQPLLKDLMERHKVETKNTLDNMDSVACIPLEQPDLSWAFCQDLRPWAGTRRREVMEGGRG